MANPRLMITLIMVLVYLRPSLAKSSECTKTIVLPKSLNLTLLTDPSTISTASHDYGNITTVIPGGVLCPSSSAEISRLLSYAANGERKFQVAARGKGHSLSGQASVCGGVIVNMTCLAGVVVSEDKKYADVAAGTLWVDVLKETAEKGVSPVTWTDYLHVTVGGTLSNAGIGGMVFRNGPQISNVLELDVITGKGEVLGCSPHLNPELFYGVLGGLGQFGIITRARIALNHAPKRVKWFRMLYSDFTAFTTDQERLISMENDIGVDYLEGQLLMSNGVDIDISFFPKSDQPKVVDLLKNHGIIYVLEVAKFYDDPTLPIIVQVIEKLTKTLSYLPGFISMDDVTYFDFLNRVKTEEDKLRPLGLWEVPHPWLNLYVPKTQILDFHNGVIKDILLKQNSTTGLALLYPTNRDKWDNRMSATIPDEDVLYVVGILPSATPQNLREVESVNEKIVRFCKESGIKIKQYLMHYTRKEDWIEHFGSKWSDFEKRKDLFDPKKLLSPGQDIF